jgi:hypothetical protein
LIANANKNSLAIIPLDTSFLELLCRPDAAVAKEKNLSGADIASLTTLGRLDSVPSEASACSE